MTIRPVFEENEGARINVPQGYDPAKIKVVGKVKGQPPYVGILCIKAGRRINVLYLESGRANDRSDLSVRSGNSLIEGFRQCLSQVI